MVVANSTMRDLFFGLDVKPIGEMPYKSLTELAMLRGEADSTWLTKRAYELGLLMHPQARVVGAPLIASHVGGDVAADLVATDFGSAPGQPACSSTSAPTPRSWPATASASWRLPARPGLPSRAACCASACPAPTAPSKPCTSATTRFVYQVIGDFEPEGICGSGLVDILAELRRVGWMTPEGRFPDGRDRVHRRALERASPSRVPMPASWRRPRPANACGQRILLRQLGLDAARCRPGLPRRRLRQRHRRRERHRHRLPRPGPARARRARRQRRPAWRLHAAAVPPSARGPQRDHRPHRARRAGDRARLLRALRRRLSLPPHPVRRHVGSRPKARYPTSYVSSSTRRMSSA